MDEGVRSSSLLKHGYVWIQPMNKYLLICFLSLWHTNIYGYISVFGSTGRGTYYTHSAADIVGKGKGKVVPLQATQRVDGGIALFFHDRGTRRGWVVSSTPRPHFTLGKDPVPILQQTGWAPGPARTGGKSRPYWDSIPDRSARSQSLYRLSYPAHIVG